jgi:hypothetical protein
MKPLTAAATGMTNIKLGGTFSNDPLPEMRFDLKFVNPPDGYEWSKDFDAVTTRKPMQYNSSVRERLGQRCLKPETLPPLLPSSFSLFTFQRSQLFSSTQTPVCVGFLAKKNALEPANNSSLFAGETEISLVA